MTQFGCVGTDISAPKMPANVSVVNGLRISHDFLDDNEYNRRRAVPAPFREIRTITIHNIEIKNIDLHNNTVDMLVDCSKGTYIRTLCNDIGAVLDCGGHMSALCRTKSGRFQLDKAFTLEEIEEMTSKEDFSFLVPVGEALWEYDRIVLAERNSKRVRNGIKIHVEGLVEDHIYRVFDEKNEFLALAQQKNGEFIIIKSFYGGAQ